MFTILLHTSKTMRTSEDVKRQALNAPLNKSTNILIGYLKSLTAVQISATMHISEALAQKIFRMIHEDSSVSIPALDIFLGDIYSGLQAQSFTPEDRLYANDHLFILSGLYGVLRALDEIQPYRLEMGYKLPGNAHDPSQPNISSLYDFWGDTIARQLPKNQPIINLSAVEYTRAVFPYIQGTKKMKPLDGFENTKIISPKFLTISPKTGEPTFVTVHAKIARGAYARWLIQNRIEDLSKLKDFGELGYRYDEVSSTPNQPVFVAKEFKGLGLSVRLTK